MRTEPNQSPIHWSLTCRRGESCSEPTRRRGYRRFSAGAATKPPRNFSSPTSASLALEELRARTLHRPACSEGRRRDVLPTRLPGLGRAVGSFLPHPFPAPGWLAPPTTPHAKAVPRGSRELSPPPRARPLAVAPFRQTLRLLRGHAPASCSPRQVPPTTHLAVGSNGDRRRLRARGR